MKIPDCLNFTLSDHSIFVFFQRSLELRKIESHLYCIHIYSRLKHLQRNKTLSMPELLQKEYKDQLVKWIGKPSHFRLLYKISRDGCSVQTFHQKCDGQGPTVTVLYNTNNTIYGGYLSQSWNSNSAYINDISAFLFRLQYNGSSNPLKFAVSNAANAGYGHSNYGPTFGGGHDIHTFSGTINKSGNHFPLNGYVYGLGNAYDLNGQNSSTITNDSLQVTDLEVYKVLRKFFLYNTIHCICH